MNVSTLYLLCWILKLHRGILLSTFHILTLPFLDHLNVIWEREEFMNLLTNIQYYWPINRHFSDQVRGNEKYVSNNKFYVPSRLEAIVSCALKQIREVFINITQVLGHTKPLVWKYWNHPKLSFNLLIYIILDHAYKIFCQ